MLRMAREAGFADGVAEIVGLEGFARFAALVAEQERQDCAKMCDDQCDLHKEANAAARARRMVQYGDDDQALMALRHHADVSLYNSGIKKCATAIREMKS